LTWRTERRYEARFDVVTNNKSLPPHDYLFLEGITIIGFRTYGGAL
jgi:hypothetical protein